MFITTNWIILSFDNQNQKYFILEQKERQRVIKYIYIF